MFCMRLRELGLANVSLSLLMRLEVGPIQIIKLMQSYGCMFHGDLIKKLPASKRINTAHTKRIKTPPTGF